MVRMHGKVYAPYIHFFMKRTNDNLLDSSTIIDYTYKSCIDRLRVHINTIVTKNKAYKTLTHPPTPPPPHKPTTIIKYDNITLR